MPYDPSFTYQRFRRWKNAWLTWFSLASEKASVHMASKLVTPVTVAVPVVATLAEVEFISPGVWWILLLAAVVSVALYWAAAWSAHNKERFACSVRSRKERASKLIGKAGLSEYQKSMGFERKQLDGRLFLSSGRVNRFIQGGGLEKPWEF